MLREVTRNPRQNPWHTRTPGHTFHPCRLSTVQGRSVARQTLLVARTIVHVGTQRFGGWMHSAERRIGPRPPPAHRRPATHKPITTTPNRLGERRSNTISDSRFATGYHSMVGEPNYPDAHLREFERRVVPLLWPAEADTNHPRLTLLIAATRSGLLGTVSDVFGAPLVTVDRLRRQIYDHDQQERDNQDLAAAWLRASLSHARRHRLPIALDITSVSALAARTTIDTFRRSAFEVDAVVLGRPGDELLLAAERWARGSDDDAALQRSGALALRALRMLAELKPNLDTVTLVDDAILPTTAPEATSLRPRSDPAPSNLSLVRWLSRLRRITESARASARLPRVGASVLRELHRIAARDVVPALGLRDGSPVAQAQLGYHAAEIRKYEARHDAGVREERDGPEIAPAEHFELDR